MIVQKEKLTIENQNKPRRGDGSEGKGTAAKGKGPDLYVFNSLYISDIIIQHFSLHFLQPTPPIYLSLNPHSLQKSWAQRMSISKAIPPAGDRRWRWKNCQAAREIDWWM